MGLFDQVFDEGNMRAVRGYSDMGKIKYKYKLDIKEPVVLETTDEAFAYKIRMLLNIAEVDYEMIKDDVGETKKN